MAVIAPMVATVIPLRKIEWCGELENGDVYLIGNASDCYSGLKVFRRHVILTEKGLVIVLDEIAAQAASSMTLHWHAKSTSSVARKTAASLVRAKIVYRWQCMLTRSST